VKFLQLVHHVNKLLVYDHGPTREQPENRMPPAPFEQWRKHKRKQYELFEKEDELGCGSTYFGRCSVILSVSCGTICGGLAVILLWKSTQNTDKKHYNIGAASQKTRDAV